MPSVSVETDQKLYAQGNTVQISGTIINFNPNSGAVITILVTDSNNNIVSIASLYNQLLLAYRDKSARYNKDIVPVLAVKDTFRDKLSKSYKSSLWTCIIDPKVKNPAEKISRGLKRIAVSIWGILSSGRPATPKT